MLARFRRRNRMLGMLIRIAADRDDIESRVAQERVQIGVTGNLGAMAGADVFGIELARRIDFGDTSAPRGIDRGDMRSGHPAITYDADVIFFHGKVMSEGHGTIFKWNCQSPSA